MVIAVNKKGRKQEFSDVAWRMLGKADKDGFRDGWKQAEAQPVNNVVSNALPTGEAAKTKKPVPPVQKVTNTKTDEGEASTTTANEANAGKAVTGNESNQNEAKTGADKKTKPVEQAVKDDFLEAIDGLSASAIKDYFDKVSVEYSKKAKIDELQNLLGETLNYSIEKFQTEFSA